MGARGWIIVCITHHLVVERLHFKFKTFIFLHLINSAEMHFAASWPLLWLFLSIHPFHIKYHYLIRRFYRGAKRIRQCGLSGFISLFNFVKVISIYD